MVSPEINEIRKYLSEIGITAPAFITRIQTHLNVCQGFCPEDITAMFVTDYRKEDGSRVYESLILFSETYAIEVKNLFDPQMEWDMCRMKDEVYYVKITSADFDYDKAVPDSRLSATARLGATLQLTLKATGVNCDYLWELIRRLIRPNLIATTAKAVTL